MTPTVLDLTPALRDSYLRSVLLGPECEPIELGFHVLRRILSPGEREEDRILGLRFSGVRGIATEAVRWDRDRGNWASAEFDWLAALARGELDPPIVSSASLGGPETIERLAKGADTALWLRGGPSALVDGPAPIARSAVLLELAAEAILPNGWNANVRLFVGADRIEAVGSKGVVALEDVLETAEAWIAAWRDYLRRKEREPDLDDPRFEWAIPAPDDLA